MKKNLILSNKGGHYGTQRTDDCIDRAIYTVIEAEYEEETTAHTWRLLG